MGSKEWKSFLQEIGVSPFDLNIKHIDLPSVTDPKIIEAYETLLMMDEQSD